MFTGKLVTRDNGALEFVIDGDGKCVVLICDDGYGIGGLKLVTRSSVDHVTDGSIYDLFDALLWLANKET